MFSLWRGIGLGLLAMLWAGFLLGILTILVLMLLVGYDKQGLQD